MNKCLILSGLLLCGCALLIGHEGHFHEQLGSIQERIHRGVDAPTIKQFGDKPQSFAQWLGGFHFIILHFPIALINMTAFAEVLYSRYKKPIYDYSATFMIVTAAILALPTAIFGNIYSTTGVYEGLLADFLQWHMIFGISTAILAIFVAYLKIQKEQSRLYYASLLLLFLIVNITGMLGGGMTFGPYHMLPPT
jgi:uncharacterized membrane protein